MNLVDLVHEEPEKIVAAYFKDPDGNPLLLAKYQSDFIKSVLRREGTRFIYKAATQSGKSLTISVLLALIAILSPNEQIINISYTEAQARIIFDQVKSFLVGQSPVIKAMVDLNRSLGSTKEFSKTKMFMKNGTEIKVLSTGMGETENVGNSLLGMSASILVIDEASSIPTDIFTTKILRMLGGVRSSGLEKILILSSTPQTSNFFEDAWNDPEYIKFSVDWKLAVEAGRLDLKTVEEQRRKMTRQQFDMWYNANFPDMMEDSVFDKEECERNTVAPDPQFYGKKILSVDIARFGRDFTVYALVDQSDDGFRVVDFLQDDKKDTMNVSGRIISLNQQYHFDKIIVDESGVGGGVLDRVKEQGIKVSGVIAGSKCTNRESEKNCMNLKAELYMKAKHLFENNKLKIINKGTIMKELRGIKKEFTSNGKIRIVDPSKSPDYVSSLVYSLYEPNSGTFIMISTRSEEQKIGWAK